MKADALKKVGGGIYTYAQNEAVVNHKKWPGFKLVPRRSNRRYTDEGGRGECGKSSRGIRISSNLR